jgi:hypothetical protein
VSYDGFGFLLVSAAALLLAGVAATRPIPGMVKRLLLLGVVLRIVGSLLRYEVLYRVYDGIGDAVGYFSMGVLYSARLLDFDFSIFSSENWWAGNWWGTQFIRYLSGLVIAVIGPTMRGEFLFFSLLAFLGLCFFGLAFARAYPHLSSHRYLAWLWLWPSLWFWSSSVGKDSILLLAGGLVTAGYVGRKDRIRWFLLIPGLLLAVAVRPHVAAIMILVMTSAHWLGLGKERWTLWRVAQGVALALLAVVVIQNALGQLGLEDADTEGVEEFVAKRTVLATGGGSAIEAPASGLSAIPMAFVNILMRPFPWEAHNPQALIASLELVVFWAVIWRRRRRVWQVLRYGWRSDRFLRFALPMSAAYVIMIGLVFGNLGIIARQRILVFPFLLLLLEAVPAEVALRRHRRLERERAALAALRERRLELREKPS